MKHNALENLWLNLSLTVSGFGRLYIYSLKVFRPIWENIKETKQKKNIRELISPNCKHQLLPPKPPQSQNLQKKTTTKRSFRTESHLICMCINESLLHYTEIMTRPKSFNDYNAIFTIIIQISLLLFQFNSFTYFPAFFFSHDFLQIQLILCGNSKKQ